MTPALTNNPLFRGITPEKLSANLEEISFHTRSYRKGEILARQGDVCNRLVILTKVQNTKPILIKSWNKMLPL